MEPYMSPFLFAACAILAWVINKIFDFFSAIYNRFERQRVKRNEILMFKIKRLFYYVKDYYLSIGYSHRNASILTVKVLEELRKNKMIDEKYKLIKKAG